MFEYFCTKCKVKITHDEPAMVTCPKCKESRNIVDYGDYQYPFEEISEGSYNWNKP